MTGQKGAYRSPFAFMMPQVLFFQFLLITTVVGVWKDLGQRLLRASRSRGTPPTP